MSHCHCYNLAYLRKYELRWRTIVSLRSFYNATSTSFLESFRFSKLNAVDVSVKIKKGNSNLSTVRDWHEKNMLS